MIWSNKYKYNRVLIPRFLPYWTTKVLLVRPLNGIELILCYHITIASYLIMKQYSCSGDLNNEFLIVKMFCALNIIELMEIALRPIQLYYNCNSREWHESEHSYLKTNIP